MAGIRRRGLVLTPRDRHLLRELGTLRLIDREQAKVVAGFGSTTRANTRLLALTRAGFLRQFFFGTIAGGRKALYTLSSKGAVLVDSPTGGIQRGQGTTLAGDLFVEHQLCLNEIHLTLRYRKRPADVHVLGWRSFQKRLSPASPLVPDGYCEWETQNGIRCAFVEVDLGTEGLRIWKQKTANYLRLALSGEFTRLFRQAQFRVLVVTRSERRLQSIREMVAKSTDKIFWFSTFEIIERDGLWSPVWLRPTGDQRHSLL